MSSAMDAIIKKCDVYYDGALISKEALINAYMSFLASSQSCNDRSVDFVLHTGSVCFDVVTIVAAGIGSLSFDMTTSDDIVDALQLDGIVMFQGQRYRWKGFSEAMGNKCFVLEQDGKGKNGRATRTLPYEKNKHLITPYYGNCESTDGRGVRKKEGKREAFLSQLSDCDISEITTQSSVSVVVLSDRNNFTDICKKISILYGENEQVRLFDVFPASYYTSNGVEYQLGPNQTKTEAVYKVASDLSMARKLVLDKTGNRSVGLLVLGSGVSNYDSSELSDLLRRKSLQYVYVTAPISSKLSDSIMDIYEDSPLFACTEKYLSTVNPSPVEDNRYTDELNKQVSTIMGNTTNIVSIPGGMSKEKYNVVRNALFAIKQSNWEKSTKDEFLLTAHGILNLLNTSVFSMSKMESAITAGEIGGLVKSPLQRIEYLWDLAENAGSMTDACLTVMDVLQTQYEANLEISPKLDFLLDFIENHPKQKIAVILPKVYYINLLSKEEVIRLFGKKVKLFYHNKFDAAESFDSVIVVGEFHSPRFDALHCYLAKSVLVMLYDCEKRAFDFRKEKKRLYERNINDRLKSQGYLSGETSASDIPEEECASQFEQEEMQRFASLDEYLESCSLFDIRKVASSVGSVESGSTNSEVTHIGVFTTGEQILFSRYYSAVVFDEATGKIEEKSPADLVPGNVLVFTKITGYTRNIVDAIYEDLLNRRRLSEESIDNYEKSQYWKEALREYKTVNNLSYRDIAKRIQALGSSIQEVSVRQWMIDDSHIVGPQHLHSMEYIATLTGDPYLLSDPNGYFEACRSVRHERREILKLIARAVKDKLLGILPPKGGVFDIVYDNIDNLSETLELEKVIELENCEVINSNLVNRPITEAEVSL